MPDGTDEDGQATQASHHPSRSPSHTRRRVLTIAAGTLATTLAGCSGGDKNDRVPTTDTTGNSGTGDGDKSGGGNTNTTTTGDTSTGTATETSSGSQSSTTGVIESVTFLPKELKVKLTFSSPEVTAITIKRPDGDTLRRYPDSSAQPVTIPLTTYSSAPTIPAGKYHVTAKFDDDGEQKGSATFTIEKQLRVTDVSTKTVPMEDEDAPTNIAFVVTAKNVGDVPVTDVFVSLNGTITDTAKLVGQEEFERLAPGETHTATLRFNPVPRDGGGYAIKTGDNDVDPTCTGSGQVTIRVNGGDGSASEVVATVALGGTEAKGRNYSSFKAFACSDLTIESISTPAKSGEASDENQ